MQNKFEPHTRPNISRLEKWRSEIEEMRSLGWPHQKIANWLDTECDFKITGEAVRQFCKVRGIQKNITLGKPPRSTSTIPRREHSVPRKRYAPKEGKLFPFEDRPIQRLR